MKLYKDNQGRKLYPVANWQNNEHKIENEYSKLRLKNYEDMTKKELEYFDSLEEAYNEMEVIDNFIYANYNHYVILKEAILNYNLRH